MNCSVNKIQLSDLIEKANTGADAIKRAPIVEENTGMRCLRIGDISNDRPVHEWGFTDATDDVIKKFKLRKDDIIVARTGNTIGVVKYIDKDINSVYNNGLIRLKVKEDYDAKYVYYNLISQDFRGFIYGISAGTSTQPNMKIDHMLQYEVANYSLKEQNKIVHILSAIDNKIELNNEMNKTLEEIAQVLFKRWFINFEFPNENGEPYKSSGGEMVESELGMIPKEWSISLLKDFAKFRSGKSIKQEFRDENGMFNIYGSNGIIGKTNEVLLSESCLIIGRVGAYCGSIQLSTLPCWVTDNALIAITNNERYIPFLHRILLKAALREKAGGSAQPLINQSILNSIEFILPEKEILDKYCKIIDNYNKIIVENEIENKQLIELRDSLLAKLMSGEIRVEDIEVNL